MGMCANAQNQARRWRRLAHPPTLEITRSVERAAECDFTKAGLCMARPDRSGSALNRPQQVLDALGPVRIASPQRLKSIGRSGRHLRPLP